MAIPCGRKLADGQWWTYCGETDMGQTSPALCTECGGSFKLMKEKDNTWYCHTCKYHHFMGEPCPKVAKRDNLAKLLAETSTLDEQVDGNHYKKLKIQPAYYSYKNKLSWHQGEIIKYVTRYKDKNGRKDLEKAIHLLEMLIEFEYDSS